MLSELTEQDIYEITTLISQAVKNEAIGKMLNSKIVDNLDDDDLDEVSFESQFDLIADGLSKIYKRQEE